MIKTIAFLKRKAGMSQEAFERYYETRHAPLILSIAPQICEYRRNFLLSEGAIVVPGLPPPDFDVVTVNQRGEPVVTGSATARLDP